MSNSMSGLPALSSWFKSFWPAAVKVDTRERLRAAIGMLLGLALTGLTTRWLLGSGSHVPLLIAPMGASAVLLFAVPASPLAQPWSIIGGNLVASVVGVTCALLIPDPILAAAVAGGIAILGMFALRCVHPPSGAVALTAVLGGPAVAALGYRFILLPVALNSILMMIAAIVYNNASGRRYPHSVPAEAVRNEAPTTPRLGFLPEDLDRVLKQYNQVLDVSRDDLESLFRQTEMQAYRRRFGEILCRDIMTSDVTCVEFATPLADAWTLLRQRRFSALPVINRGRRVIGMLTLADFMGHADLGDFSGISAQLRRLLRPSHETHGEKPEVVGQLMSTPVRSAQDDMHIVELLPMLTEQHWHHLPVVDSQQRLVGILTQSDIIAALYRGNMSETRQAALSA